MFFWGTGIERNLAEAVKLWASAAEKGNSYAQFNLAEMYMAGWGVPRDFAKAYSLFTLAGKTLDVSKQLRELSSKMNQGEAPNDRLLLGDN
jgi:TPR repeat protein